MKYKHKLLMIGVYFFSEQNEKNNMDWKMKFDTNKHN